MTKPPPRVLIVAGSDSGGGAGIQADIKTATMLGAFATTAVTALTAQNTLGVEGVLPVPAAFVLAQIDVVLADLGTDAIKFGMIGSAETANALADRLQGSGVPIVFDPVMVASSGSALADPATIAAFERLMAVATIITPNLPELEALTGRTIAGVEQLQTAALLLAERSGTAVLAKGGHLAGDLLTDILVEPDGKVRQWQSERVDTRNTHGTGCTLATAIACGLGEGRSLEAAVVRARLYVRATIAAAPGFGAGHGPMGHSLGVDPFALIER